jgi:hypothetical protein
MRRMFVVCVLALAVVAVLLVAGCGGGDAQPASETEIRPADQALAERIVLRTDDFPAGWTVDEEFDEEAETGSLVDVPATCSTLLKSKQILRLVVTGEAESDDFTDGFDYATSSVTVFNEPAGPAFALWASDEMPACLQELADEMVEEEPGFDGGELGAVTVKELSFPSIGADSCAYRLSIEMLVEDFPVDAYVDFVIVSEGRVVGAVLLAGALTPFEREVAVDLVTTLAERMHAEQGAPTEPDAL